MLIFKLSCDSLNLSAENGRLWLEIKFKIDGKILFKILNPNSKNHFKRSDLKSILSNP